MSSSTVVTTPSPSGRILIPWAWSALFGFILLVHPLLSLLVLAACNLASRIGRAAMGVWSVAFGVLIVFRQYGVSWSDEADDDAPIYFDVIRQMTGRSLGEVLFDPSLAIDMEPVPKLFWWAAHHVTGSILTVLLLQCLIWLWAFWRLSEAVSPRHPWVVFAICLLVLPSSLTYEVLHLYRSAWAMCFMALAFSAELRRSRMAFPWAALAVLSHVSALLFVIALAATRLFEGGKVKWKHVSLAALGLGLLYALAWTQLTDSVFAQKALLYLTSDFTPERDLRIVKSLAFAIAGLYLYTRTSRGSVQRTALICLALVLAVSLEPALNSISDRLLILYAPVCLACLLPARDRVVLGVALAAAAIRSVTLFLPDSILGFSVGAFDYPLRVPIVDLSLFVLRYPSSLGFF